MKKSMLTIIALIIAMLLLVACDGNSGTGNTDTTYETTEYVDGVEATAPVEKGNYVVYVRSTDDSRWFAWDYENWSIKDADASLNYSVYFFKVDSLFDSVEALEAADNVTAGTLVGTKSYHAGLGRGAAIYEILDKKPTESGIITLENLSLYARVVPFTVNDEKIITVDQFGTYGDGERADHGKINVAFKFADANVIEFESSVYMQESGIILNHGDVRLNAKGAEIHNRYDKAVVLKDFTVSGKNERIKNIIIENLTLVCTEKRGAGHLYVDRSHGQFVSAYVDGITVRNCTFHVPPTEEGEPYRNSSCVTFGEHSTNVTFENNRVLNFARSEGYSSTLFFTPGIGNLMENVKVLNNYIEKSGHDETLSFYHGIFNNILVDNNTFYTHDELVGFTSRQVIGFGAWDCPTTVKNAVFSNNKLDVVTRNNAVMFSDVENIKIFNNEITVRNNSESEPITYGVFRITYHQENYAAAGIPNPTQKNVEIYNNTVKVYNPTEVPMNYNCNEGFDFHDNTFEYIPVNNDQ